MRMARLWVAVATVLAVLGTTALGRLTIDRFDTEITVHTDGAIAVTERIAVTFHTPHHGIEREIPFSYRDPRGGRVTIDLDIERIALDSGPVLYTSRRSGGDLVLRIGDPDRTITGSYLYTIGYTVGRAILFHDDYLQLYWNVTGNAWRVPIDRATATVVLPETVDLEAVSTISYIDRYGGAARGSAATTSSTGELQFATGTLFPGEGMTIDVAIPRSQLPIDPPSFGQRVLWFVGANAYAGLPLLALATMFIVWYRVGKDPRKRSIAPAFEPPRGIHPGAAGVLIDDRADLHDLSAMLIGLAVKGYLTIEEVDEAEGLGDRVKRMLGRSSTDYRFVRRSRSTDRLAKVERDVLDAVFDEEHPEERTLSSLESSFYQHLPGIKTALYEGLIERGDYPHNPERTRSVYRFLGIAGIALGVMLGLYVSSLYLGLAVGLSGLVVLAFAPLMPRKTKQGVRTLEQLLGLSEYIRRAELDRIEFHDAPEKSPELFEKLLPYAIALNLTTIWAKRFEATLDRPPDWYVGQAPVFRASLFTASMLHLTSGLERSFASAPRSAGRGGSAWGGGSSFGGGFSGGGFGGGGGGGW